MLGDRDVHAQVVSLGNSHMAGSSHTGLKLTKVRKNKAHSAH